MPKGISATLCLTGLASGIGGVGLGLVGFSEAACFGAGGAMAVMLLAGGSGHLPDSLYPARMQLARFRRTGQPADVLVVEFAKRSSIADRRPTRKCARAVSSVLRITDGVAMVPSLGGNGLCAVLEADGRARGAIDARLSDACGDEIRTAWASSPEDGVTLESLLQVATDRLPSTEARRRPRQSLWTLPLGRLLPRVLRPERQPMRPAR
jgi:hypothetical protein